MYSIRKYQDSLVMDLNKPVHPDTSQCSISSAKPQVVPTVTTAKDSAIVDEEKYSEFVRRSVLTSSFKLIQEASMSLARHTTKVFKETPGCWGLPGDPQGG